MAKVEQKPHEITEEERQRLVNFMDILIQIDQQEKARFARLKDEPNVPLPWKINRPSTD